MAPNPSSRHSPVENSFEKGIARWAASCRRDGLALVGFRPRQPLPPSGLEVRLGLFERRRVAVGPDFRWLAEHAIERPERPHVLPSTALIIDAADRPLAAVNSEVFEVAGRLATTHLSRALCGISPPLETFSPTNDSTKSTTF